MQGRRSTSQSSSQSDSVKVCCAASWPLPDRPGGLSEREGRHVVWKWHVRPSPARRRGVDRVHLREVLSEARGFFCLRAPALSAGAGDGLFCVKQRTGEAVDEVPLRRRIARSQASCVSEPIVERTRAAEKARTTPPRLGVGKATLRTSQGLVKWSPLLGALDNRLREEPPMPIGDVIPADRRWHEDPPRGSRWTSDCQPYRPVITHPRSFRVVWRQAAGDDQAVSRGEHAGGAGSAEQKPVDE